MTESALGRDRKVGWKERAGEGESQRGKTEPFPVGNLPDRRRTARSKLVPGPSQPRPAHAPPARGLLCSRGAPLRRLAVDATTPAPRELHRAARFEALLSPSRHSEAFANKGPALSSGTGPCKRCRAPEPAPPSKVTASE